MKEFKPYSNFRELFIPKNELADYYVKKRAYNYVHCNEKATTFKKQEKMHNFLMKLFRLNRKFVDKQNYSIISDLSENKGKNVIYAVTHIGKFDYQILTEALKIHTIPFAGDPELTYRNLDGLIFGLNGAVFIDTNSKSDRKVAYDTAVDVLKNGYNLMIFPEGIWNLSPNNLMQPIYPGVIKMASESECEIIPVAIEQYESDFLINIGKNISIPSNLSNEEIDKYKQTLRDLMATLKYEIIESFSEPIDRDTMGNYEDEKENAVNTRLNEYVDPKTKENYFDKEFVDNRVYKEKNQVKPDDAFSYFKDVVPNKNNAFMFRKDDSLPNSVYEEIENYNSLMDASNSDENTDAKTR